MLQAFAALLALAAPASAQAGSCRLALVLALDVSFSVDAHEYRLQLDGLAEALDHPEVRARLLAMPSAPVELAIFEWSGPEHQRRILGWTRLDGPAALDRATARLRGWPDRPDGSGGTTAIGSALAAGVALLRQRPGCWRAVIDLSGDGENNAGPAPAALRTGGLLDGITVNALAIGENRVGGDDLRSTDLDALVAFFRAEVLHGPGAFVKTARGHPDFARAMRRKLLRETELPVLGRAR